jgi:hypothetical protein
LDNYRLWVFHIIILKVFDLISSDWVKNIIKRLHFQFKSQNTLSLQQKWQVDKQELFANNLRQYKYNKITRGKNMTLHIFIQPN